MFVRKHIHIYKTWKYVLLNVLLRCDLTFSKCQELYFNIETLGLIIHSCEVITNNNLLQNKKEPKEPVGQDVVAIKRVGGIPLFEIKIADPW